MRLSTRSRLGIIAVMYLAQNSKRPVNASTLSRDLDISISYLEQLFAKLRASGFVSGIRGPTGGYRLAMELNQINVADIILAIDDKAYVRDRSLLPGGEKNNSAEMWMALSDKMHEFLKNVTLADLQDSNSDELSFNPSI